jgi:hypothetical protein
MKSVYLKGLMPRLEMKEAVCFISVSLTGPHPGSTAVLHILPILGKTDETL